MDGRYEIKELIGVGGMAYVYKAYDSIDDRVVAIKILKDEFLANEEFTRRFKNESKAIAILSHPNIVKVYDVSFGERLQYIVMEYIDGITLKEYIEQQKDIKWKEAVHFTVQILRALQHAHDKGIVHRDIKPQNIMLLADGTIKVTDFGIARFSRTDIRATSATDKAIGSVHYISPEQARGEITDEKADIYSVGVMLYEMLTGRLPFEADNAVSVAIMQLQSEPKQPREINPQIPEGLEDITIKAMQKDPAKRYQSAAEMLYDIDEFKRNPSIHFEYKYFVDETPTRFVEAITKVKGEPEEALAEAEEDEEEEEVRKGPPIIPILSAVAGAFVLVALVFVGIIFFLGIDNDKDKIKDVVVPNLVGRNYASDVALNSDWVRDFKFELTYAHNATVPVGNVIESDPPAGRSVKQHSTVTLTISKGPNTSTVPDVVDESVETARAKLRNQGFQVNEIPRSSETVPEGNVVSMDPVGGTELAEGSIVTLFVSSGKEPLEKKPVPNVTGAAQTDAEAKLLEKGFNPKVVEVNHKDYKVKGIVISQEPAADTTLEEGQEVTITVSSGYQDVRLEVTMPDSRQQVDMEVFVAGQKNSELSAGLTNIVPGDLDFKTFILTNRQDKYAVTIKIALTGTKKWQDYFTCTVDGINGTILDFAYPPLREPLDPPSTTTEPTTEPTAPQQPDDPSEPSSKPDKPNKPEDE